MFFLSFEATTFDFTQLGVFMVLDFARQKFQAKAFCKMSKVAKRCGFKVTTMC